ncbi:hypothetical protein MBLNU459_g2569t1 [Dothideomycetes sp. NU459]
MKKFMDKAKSAIHKNDGSSSQQQQPLVERPSSIQEPTPADVMRYRYQHGTNLGSVFVLEKWLTGSMYPENAESAELAAVTGNIKEQGLDAARAKFENHWHNYASDADLDWLANDAHCNSIRLPIGYFTLGPAYCQDTPFASASPVYENAWAAVKHLVARCHQRGIGVLVDLHALPGGANVGDHSGTNSGKAELWKKKSYQELATRCLLFIAKEAKTMDGVIGIQLCNEAEWDAHGMYDWYDSAISQMGGIDDTMPIYISDAWNLGQAVKYCKGKNGLGSGTSNPIVIDTHLYWAFSDDDRKKAPQQITQEVHGKLGELSDGNVVDNGAAQVVVGEYSCVLTEDSWGKASGDQKGHLVHEFGQAQSQRYQSRAGGSFFWTYRMDWMDGGEWGFKQQTLGGAITAPHNLSLSHQDVQSRIQNAQSQQQNKAQATCGSHCNYWDSNHPGQYEHERFEKGWHLGFNDAQSFFGMRANRGIQGAGGDKIGMLDIWTKKRIIESGQAGKFLWEFEQGFRQGVRDFYELAGV